MRIIQHFFLCASPYVVTFGNLRLKCVGRENDIMSVKKFFHAFANGSDAKNLLISDEDFVAAFNWVGVCAAHTAAQVVCFALEDTHPHFLLYGHKADCLSFVMMYQKGLLRYVFESRRSLDGVRLDCDLLEIKNEKHLMNTGVYVINQATKDGKHVLPGDYRWGTGCLYFRPKDYFSIWEIGPDRQIFAPVAVGSMTFRQKRRLLHTHRDVPPEWLVCDGILLPQNYVDTSLFEGIYRTHRCFNSFLGSKRGDDEVDGQMTRHRGVAMETIDARAVCSDICFTMFHKKSARWLAADQRVMLAKQLRSKYHLSFKQLSALCRLPEDELHKYIT